MQNIKDKLLLIIVALGAIGLVDALYLSYARYAHVSVPCSITNGGCSIVAASPYAVMFGVPLAYLGVLFYLGILLLSILLVFGSKIKYLKELLLLLTIFGAIDSLYFLYLQGFVIKAFCIYCIISAVITFLLLVAASILNNKPKTWYNALTNN